VETGMNAVQLTYFVVPNRMMTSSQRHIE